MKPLILIALILTAFLPTTTLTYNREAHLTNEFLQNGGCAWDRCPQVLIDEALAETNGLYPPAHYARDTRGYWRSYCTYLADKCK